MEAHFLRTLSDSGDFFPPTVDHLLIDQVPDDDTATSAAAVPDAFIASPAAGVVTDDQLRVSSPDSESSKDGTSL